MFRYRKNKDSDQAHACAKTHPTSALAQGANIFTVSLVGWVRQYVYSGYLHIRDPSSE
uniref:Uncharacterized protein n=1 Tax=Candidatus Kentrum sp. LFY TaxID=2126342 RepID=A0A450WVN3_9GAMM|nr:MAG: hypothetical protein BECKLFY1418C_GA0070996_10869 [Candidatus Kentron sp. LFY]